jgi:hypothetical protein
MQEAADMRDVLWGKRISAEREGAVTRAVADDKDLAGAGLRDVEVGELAPSVRDNAGSCDNHCR